MIRIASCKLLIVTWLLLPRVAAGGGGDAAAIVKKATEQQAFRAAGIEMRLMMRLRNKRGETRDRALYARSMRKDRLSRTLVRFLRPADVAGTSFLFLENRDREDDQHMYLPALKVVRRIIGSQKNASFMGSDLSYADLEWRALERATYKMQPAEKIGADPCHVIEAIPRQRESYSRLRAWIRQRDKVLLRLQFFDKRGKLLKTLFVKEVKRVGGMPMATKMKIANAKNGHVTFFAITETKLRDDLAEEQFTVRALKKR
jgi:hypothetical protein